jgi:MYXO-CTERM domain-containing protein
MRPTLPFLLVAAMLASAHVAVADDGGPDASDSGSGGSGSTTADGAGGVPIVQPSATADNFGCGVAAGGAGESAVAAGLALVGAALARRRRRPG